MNASTELRVSYDVGCIRSLKKLPPKISNGFLEMMARLMTDPTRAGANFETVQGARDKGIKSIRIDQGYRAIGYISGRDLLLLHVNEHDKAYRWAENRHVRVDPNTNRIRIVEEVQQETVEVAPTQDVERLFSEFSDQLLMDLGIMPEELRLVRSVTNEADLDGLVDRVDTTSHEILLGLAAGYAPAEVREVLAISTPAEDGKQSQELLFSEAITTNESRQTIFTPESEREMRRFLEGDMEAWRVFLHPDQRRFAYRDYNGPALVRGGAGTGKTVVAMHRAKYLADQIAADSKRDGQRVLVTTFTTNLAKDIEHNLRILCPEHLEPHKSRIEVINLDAWVSDFLRRRRFAREVVFFSNGTDKISEIWDEVLEQHGCPEGLSPAFIRAEWAQIVQSKGVDSQRSYFKIPRTGRGTPLDRKKRAALWTIFEDYRARLLDEGLAEPDDAYREAITLLQNEAAALPYSGVIVDEAQDMGEQAFRLIRAIVPSRPDGDKNSIFIVGDAHQRIYARKASMSACGIEVRGRSRKLRLNYRTTDEIRRWAVAVLEGVPVDDLDEGLDSLKGYTSLFRGPEPALVGYANPQKEMDGLIAWMKELQSVGLQDADIGVLVRTRRQADQVMEAIATAGLAGLLLSNASADDRKAPGLRVTTMHRSKGLEFAAVALPFLSDGTFPPKGMLKAAVDAADLREMVEREKSLLHVAATRAKKVLRVSWSGSSTPLISDAQIR